MSDQGLRKPRRKPKAGLYLLESPFPVPIQTITGKAVSNATWYYYFGHLKADHVAIFRLGDLTFLYRLGFFGKGMLSRSRPQFEKYNDVLSEYERKRYLYKYTPLEADERELKIFAFAKLQNERLRQHSLWSKEERDKAISSCKTEVIVQCEDFNTHVDDGLHEELTTDGEDDDGGIEFIGNSKQKKCLETKEKLIIGGKRPSSPSNQGISSEEVTKLEDSYKLFEYLQLTFEEAFFLSYGLGCLSVQDDQQHSMTLSEMWKDFSCRKESFIEHYIAYHHFRSKGWVARFGNLYGADFLLYQDGMPFYHASYSVFVILVDEENLTSLKQPPLDWKHLSCVCRVNEKVAKEVLLCYVVRPKGLSEEEMMSVSCINRFKVMEIIMRRWIPEKYREIKP